MKKNGPDIIEEQVITENAPFQIPSYFRNHIHMCLCLIYLKLQYIFKTI